MRFVLPTVPIALLLSQFQSVAADESKYRIVDPALKSVVIDSSPDESFLSIRADSMGRLFVGGREALFVYEPDEGGGYQPRQELYRFPNHSWVYDIEIRGNDVYALTLSALYLFKDAVTKRNGVVPQRLIWGPPDWHVHQAFHGLAWGPEGDLYISMGDLLVFYGDFTRPDHWGHWTMFSQPEGTRTPYTGVGGVFRCKPDGSDLRVVAGGTRNSCGLVFDSRWNLFCNDNDHEGLPTEFVPGRLIHVTPYADFGWPRGWMPRMTPDRADLLETIVADMGRAVPVGQTYYDEAFLPDEYRNNLLVARWGIRSITRYPLRERGASFSADEYTLLEGFDTTRPVGVAVGRGGRVFAALAYMAHNEGSPTYPSDLIMITRADDDRSHPFEPVDLTAATPEVLASQLASDSSWPSRRAHTELLRRDAETRAVAVGIARQNADAHSDATLTSHLEWLAASLWSARPNERVASRAQEALGQSATGPVTDRLRQFVRAATEFLAADQRLPGLLEAAIRHPDATVQLAGVTGWFRVDRPVPEALIEGPAQSEDSYLRQASAILLARKASRHDLAGMLSSSNPRIRLAGVLAVGFRLTLPEPTSAPAASLPLQPYPNDDPYVIEYANETIDLREYGRVGLFTLAEHWRAADRTEQQEGLFSLLLDRLDDEDQSVALQAAHFLSLLRDDRAESKIGQLRRRTQLDRLASSSIASPGQVWVAGPFDDRGAGFGTVHSLETSAIDLNESYGGGKTPIRWGKVKRGRMFNFREHFGDTAGHSVYAYFRLNSPRAQPIMLLPGSDDGIRVWRNGELVHDHDVERGGLPLQDVVYVDLEPGSNDVLVRVRNIADEHNLYLHYRSLQGSVKWTLPERFDEAGLAARLSGVDSGTAAEVAKALSRVDWQAAVQHADPQRGRRLFSEDGIGCAKCHSVSTDVAVQGGPSLASAGRRFTRGYLVESVLLPSRQLSPVFTSTLLVTEDGQLHRGLVLGETAEHIDLLTPEAKRITIGKSAIDERKQENVSPMPAGLIRKPDELADLVAYLLSLR